MHVALGEVHAQSTPRGDSTDFIETLGEAHDPDDRKGGSRVRSVRLFFKKESHAAFFLSLKHIRVVPGTVISTVLY
eukprot:COSAG02_NODE_1228_length_13776_cov_5.546864_3_plen_76_part_00